MNRTILIVEDEFLIAMALQDLLEQLDWQVMGPVANVQGALRLLERSLPSVALLDVNLGREMVTPVAEFLKRRNVKFILASTYTEPELYGGSVLAGAINVGKPINERHLRAALAQLN